MNQPAPTPQTFKIGLRFPLSDAQRLFELAEQVRSGQRPDRDNLVRKFEATAQDALIGEPTIVFCRDLDDLRRLVASYVELGCSEPEVCEVW